MPPPGDELASIIVLCCNELAYTRLCLESVLRHTRSPYELVIVDNGSSEAISRTPEDALLWVVLSHALLQEGSDLDRAEEALRMVLKLDPGNAEARNNLAVLLRQRGRGPEA